MEFLKNFFCDDDQVVGLCPFKTRQEEKTRLKFEPKTKTISNFVYGTTAAENFFLL